MLGKQYVIGIGQDITERKRVEDTLQLKDFAIESSINAIAIADLSGNLTDINPAFLSIWGYEHRQEVLGRSVLSFWKVPDEAQQVVDGIQAQGTWSGEMTGQRKDGTPITVQLSANLIRDVAGTPVAMMGSFIDITERKRVEEALAESESFNRGLVENLPDYIVVYGSDGKILYVNPASARLLGYDADKLVGTPLLLYIAEGCRDEVVSRIAERRKGGEVSPYEINLILSDGRQRTVIVKGTPIQYHDNPVVLLLLIDITERKQMDEALKMSEQKYRNVVEDQTEFICQFLPDGTHIFVNDAYCRYFDKKREEIIGHMFRPVLHPEDREPVARHLTSLTTQHPVMDIDQRVIMPDGSIRWQRWSDRAIFDPDGRVIEYQSVGRDITKQKELEKEMDLHALELQKFSTSLTAANKKLTLLTSITRHDINNQLTVLRGYLAILKKKQPDSSLTEYFQKVNAAAQHISSMIQFTEEYENIGVNAPVWQNCCTLVDTAAKQVPLGTVMVKNDLPASTEMFADPLIGKVFYNLMDNAARYGGKITTIRFSVQEHEGDYVVVCEDDGDGIPAGEKEKIFECGFGKNTGLGLALSREILDITGITIHETGEPGKGARFEMVVPKGAWRMTETDRGKD
jgi:PAS domain S-box-containing protein